MSENRRIKKAKKNEDTDKYGQVLGSDKMTATVLQLPPEILIKIFRFDMEDEGQQNLLRRVSTVCRKWEAICQDPCLWKNFDGTVNFRKMLQLSRTGILDRTTELVISKTDSVSEEDANAMFEGLGKTVEVVSFKNVKKISQSLIRTLGVYCENLKEIEFGNRAVDRKIRYFNIKDIFIKKGLNLTSIKICHSYLTCLSQCIRDIANHCMNLENLFLMQVCGPGVFPTKLFQSNCPKLKSLYLDYNITLTRDKHSSGFPELEAFTYIDSEGKVADKEFECVLFNSPKLKFLQLIRSNVTPEAMCLLPTCNLEHLYLSQSVTINCSTFHRVLEKWANSLKLVDVSHSTSMIVNEAVGKLSLPHDSPLEILNMNFTKVTASIVKRALKNCSRLKELHLRGCRNLGRGMKRSYIGKTDFKILSDCLENLAMTSPELFDISEE